MIFKRVCLGFILVAVSALAYAADCSQYLGKGYCTDYIFNQTGQRQSGDAKNWTGDHDLSLLRKGDVAIFVSGAYGHVALVDQVNRDASGTPITTNLSEWNYGSTYVNEACAVTNTFGIRTTRNNVPVSSITRFWHIGGSTPPGYSCSRLSSLYAVCWQPNTDASCKGGKNWELFAYDTAETLRVSDSRYCPTDASSIGGSGTPPVTGSNNSGSLPDLVMRDVYLEDANYNRVTTLHIGEKGHCHMSVINNGAVKAKGTFENRCWLSVGNQFDGSDAENIGKEDMSDLDNGQSRVSHEDFYAPAYPGKRNLVGCTDASSKIVESNEKNNCNLGSEAILQEYRFEVWSSPNLTTTAIGLTNGRTVLNVNEPFVLSSTIYNAGENFGQDYVYIGYFDNGVLIGQNQILRENMQGGYSKIEDMAVPLGIATAGVHELKACPDFINAIAETNEADNCMSVRVEVRDPNAPFPCPVITQATWGPPWSTTMPAPYNNPPFKADGTLVVTPWCVENLPNHLEIVVQGTPNFYVSSAIRIKNGVTGSAYVTYPSSLSTCSVPRQPGSAWCSGEVRLTVEGKDVDTSVANKPTQILVYTCDLIGGLVTNCRWMLQMATISAKQ